MGVSSLECTCSVFNITIENNSFSIIIPGHWESNLAKTTVYKLNKLLCLKSQNNIDLHVQAVKKRGHQIKIGDKEYNLSDFGAYKEEILEGLKHAKDYKLEDMVFRFQLTYDEIINILNIK